MLAMFILIKIVWIAVLILI